MTPRTRSILLGAAMVLMTVIAYVPALRGGFIWDDDHYVTANIAVLRSDGIGRIWVDRPDATQYYPLTLSTFWLEYRLWGASPLGYKLVNVALHAASAVLVWQILLRLGVPGPWLAGALFALHPVHVESVAWITERKNTLSGLLYLAAVLLYVPRLRGGSLSRSRYVAVLVLFAAAMLSKTVTATLPAALLLLTWWRTGRLTRRDWLLAVPMFLLAVAAGVMTVLIEREVIGARGEEFALGIADRLLVAGRASWFYLQKLLVPYPLLFVYPKWGIDPSKLLQWLAPAAVVVAVVGLWLMRHRWGRGPLVAALFFLGTLAPALGFVNVYPFRFSFVADHFQYLASLGILVAVGALLVRVRPAAVAVLLVLGGMTFAQGRVYRDVETLWRHTLRHNPDAWMARANLADVLTQKGQLDEAWDLMLKVREQRPADPEPLLQLAQIAARRGEFGRAIELARSAIPLAADSPEPWFQLGRIQQAQGDKEGAIESYRSALKINPTHDPSLNNLGVMLLETGHPDEAVQQFQAAIEAFPDSAIAHINLARLLQQRGESQRALEHWEAVLETFPDNVVALEQAGILRAQAGDLETAARRFSRAIKVMPNEPSFYHNLGQVRLEQGRYDEAIECFEAALARNRAFPGSAEGLARARRMRGL
jgi:tetratricopeptide (TPR) repeat protein